MIDTTSNESGKAFPRGRACGLGRPLLRGHPATPPT